MEPEAENIIPNYSIEKFDCGYYRVFIVIYTLSIL